MLARFLAEIFVVTGSSFWKALMSVGWSFKMLHVTESVEWVSPRIFVSRQTFLEKLTTTLIEKLTLFVDLALFLIFLFHQGEKKCPKQQNVDSLSYVRTLLD